MSGHNARKTSLAFCMKLANQCIPCVLCITKLTSAPTLPAEILRMDKTSIELYKKALAEGNISTYSIRVMVVGQSGVGKTTLTKRLLEEYVDLHARNPTDGIDVHVGRCRVSRADQRWTVLKKDEKVENVYEKKVAQVLAKQSISETTEKMAEPIDDYLDFSPSWDSWDSNVSSSSSELGDSDSDSESGGFDNNSSPHEVTVPKEVDDADAETVEIIPSNDTITEKSVEVDPNKNAIMKDLKNLKECKRKHQLEITPENDYADISFWDFAGQSVFYTTHQIFLSSRAIYLLVTDISKHIDDIVDDDICYFDIKGAESYKIIEFFNLWLNSIHSICPSGKKVVPRVILVATHADKLDQKTRQEQVRKYFQAVRNTFNEGIAGVNVVDTEFAINNAIDDPNLVALKQKIYEVASKQDYWGEKIPAKWLTLERDLGELCDKIITRDKLRDVNGSMPVPIAEEESVDLFLRFHHQTGNILYFNDADLCDCIVLDPQWLVDCLKSLITAEMFRSKDPQIAGQWKKMRSDGILKDELIDAVWEPEGMKTFRDHKDHLLQLMKKLNIIARMDDQTHEGCYLVPCMLKAAPAAICIKDADNSTPNMCITTSDGFLRVGVFERLLAGCASKWKLSKQGNKLLIFCGYGCFEIDRVHRMTLYFRAGTIQMWVSCYSTKMPDPNPERCAEVREYVLQILKKINTCLSISQSLELSIKCPDIQGLNEIPVEGMFKIDELVMQRSVDDEMMCDAHEKRHTVSCSDLLRPWYGEHTRRESDDENYTREKTPTDKQLRNIASKIGKEYEHLGFELELSHEEIEQIKLNNPHDVVMQTTKILLAWKKSAGCQATFGVLEQAMIAVNIDTTKALAGIK